ncbi:MAG: ATP-binding cassette domain-containing protein [Caulobacterales bacterium]
MTAVLELQNVQKQFGGRPAVRGVSLAVEQGAIFGFLGPNGAGKTTSLRMALGIIEPDAGSALLFGKRPSAESLDRVGFLPEERGLYRKMKCEDIIVYFARLKGMHADAARLRARELLQRFGLADYARRKVKDLSKGMAQKIQVLAAVVHNPDLVILDEPFSGLDPVNQSALEDLVRDLAAQGRTVIFSTHVMEHAERLCDRIALIAGGRKIFDGGVREALAHCPRWVEIEAPKQSDMDGVAAALGAVAERSDHVCDDPEDIRWRLVLPKAIEPQAALRACLSRGVDVRLFEPHRPRLRDAFVQLVGDDDAAQLRTEGAALQGDAA